MSRLVMKFGGTSVANLERIRNVAQHVKREVDAGHEVAVVVSAMSGKTNELVAWCADASAMHDAREYDAVVASGPPDRNSKAVVTRETLSNLFSQVFASGWARDCLSVVWHAGEPMVVPIPFYRDAFRMIDRLKQDGARVIAYDVQFTEPTVVAEDNALIEAIGRAGNVVLSTRSCISCSLTTTSPGRSSWFRATVPTRAAHVLARLTGRERLVP